MGTKQLPQRFRNGDEFMDYVYNRWPSRDTHVERQGGAHWMAFIEGDPLIKQATYDAMSKRVDWWKQDPNDPEEVMPLDENKETTMKTPTKYKLINNAQKRNNDMKQIVENINAVAAVIDTDAKTLLEGATQVLAGLKQLIDAGQPLAKAGMNPASLAGVVAGLRVLTGALPKITDPQKQTRALKILGGLQIGPNMSANIASVLGGLAEKDPQVDDLKAAFQKYAQTPQPDPALSKLLGQLQVQVDQAQRAATQQQPQQQAQQQQPAAQGTPQPAVQSGTVSTVGQSR